MKCIAQNVHDEHIFWVKLHGGKVKSTFNYRKHIELMKTKKLSQDLKKKLDDLGDRLLRKQEEIGRQRTGNKD